MSRNIKITLVLGSILIVVNQWHAWLNDGKLDWFPAIATYVLIFACLYGVTRWEQRHTSKDGHEAGSSAPGVLPEHIETLYKHAIIVERNARKANAAFSRQLIHIHELVEQARALVREGSHSASHQQLVHELEQLEHRISTILKEMEKNVKLGEKLQQSVANIDPEIGIF